MQQAVVDKPVDAAGASAVGPLGALVAHARWEDAAIALWLILVGPLLALTSTPGAPVGAGAQPLRGVLYVAGAVAAIVCLGVRPAGGPPTLARILGSEAEWLIGPLIGGVALLLSLGVDDLGGQGGALVVPIIVASIVVALLASRLPSVSTDRRRLLMLPFILAASDLFQSIFRDLDVGAMIASVSGTNEAGLLGFVLAFALLGPLVFYVMLIYAPRQVAEREGTALGWTVRYGVFLASSVLGLGWLRLI